MFFLLENFSIVLKMNTANAAFDLAVFRAAIYDGYCRAVAKNYTIKPDVNPMLGIKFNFNFKTENKLSIEQLNHIGARLCGHFSKFVTPEIMESEDESKIFYISPQANFEKQSVQIQFGQEIDYPFVMEVPLIEF